MKKIKKIGALLAIFILNFYNILVDNFESEELICFLTFYNA